MSDQATWQSICPNLSHVMSQAKDENLYTDIQFVIGKEPLQKTFFAHKNILASGSPVFEKMFYGEMAEKRNPIVIEEDDPEAFDMLLNYIYGRGDKINLSSFLSSWKYHSIGDKYLIKGIADDVERFIKCASMKEEDFWNLTEYKLFEEQIFCEKINNYIQENTSGILKTENFLNIPESLVTKILLLDKLNVSEFELLQSIGRWGDVNFKSERKTERMMQLLQHIRFSLLSLEEFLQFTDDFPEAINLLNCMKITKYLHNKSVYALPDSFSAKTDSRNIINLGEMSTLLQNERTQQSRHLCKRDRRLHMRY